MEIVTFSFKYALNERKNYYLCVQKSIFWIYWANSFSHPLETPHQKCANDEGYEAHTIWRGHE